MSGQIRGALWVAFVFSLAALLIATAGVLPEAQAQREAVAKTVILVRHAEARRPPDDPPLTDEGRARAEMLAQMLREAGVGAIYASEFARTQQTAAPLAKLTGVETQIVAGRDIRGIAQKARASEAKVIVVAGHSNTVPMIIQELGGPEYAQIPETDFDNLFVLTLGPSGTTTAVRLKYGAPPAKR